MLEDYNLRNISFKSEKIKLKDNYKVIKLGILTIFFIILDTTECHSSFLCLFKSTQQFAKVKLQNRKIEYIDAFIIYTSPHTATTTTTKHSKRFRHQHYYHQSK